MSFKYNSRFIKYLYRENESINHSPFACIAALAKSDFIDIRGAAGGVYNYLQYALNPMGDPELPLFTRLPLPFDNVRISRFENTLMVNTGGVSGSTICLTSLDLEDGYQEVAESVSYHTFENFPEAFQVTITAPNRIPYKYVAGTVIGIEDDIASYIYCFPNPVDNILHVDIDLSRVRLELYNMQGMLLLSEELSHGAHSIPMSAYTDGTYIVRMQANQGNTWFKILKNSDR
jgi:hypothetical protein